MDNKNQEQEFDLDEILNEFHELADGDTEEAGIPAAEMGMELKEELDELDQLLEELPDIGEVTLPTAPAAEEEAPVQTPDAAEAAPSPEGAPMDTISMVEIIKQITADDGEPDSETEAAEAEAEPVGEAGAEGEVSGDATIRIDEMDSLPGGETAEAAEPEGAPEEEAPAPEPIVFSPHARLRELKKKLVAGPEKRYYELSEVGVGKLQAAILVNILITLLCSGVAVLYTMDLIPENRLRFVIFSQVLAMLISALLGCHLMLDSLGELLKGKFTINTLLTVSFIACCVDAVFCLRDLRVPCCAAFSLEMTLALWGRCQRRSTEMAQMDTLRKAVRLNSVVKEPDFFEGKPGILRGEGQVEDFMDTYNLPSGPEKVQSGYAFFSLLACIGIAALAAALHGPSLAVQVFSTSLLAAVPASAFITVSRPMAVLERRLHMVGTVLCGWQGVKALGGKAAFPLSDEDLFPQGSTKLNGVKFYGDRDPDDVVSYTTSLICAAGGGLVPVFRQMLNSRNGMEHPVENFQNYGSGGIGGEVCGEPVLLGSLNFLQDMGVEIPEGTMVNQAVYASIDGQLCAVFAISYAKMRSSAAGLVSLCSHRKLTPVLTGGDFMLTESLLRGKFGVNTRRIAFPDQDTRRELAARQPSPEAPALALATREDLVSYAYAVSGARSLRTATNLGVAIHLIAGILGLVIMAVLAYLGSAELLTPTHVLLYQLVWMIPGLLVTEWTRTV